MLERPKRDVELQAASEAHVTEPCWCSRTRANTYPSLRLPALVAERSALLDRVQPLERRHGGKRAVHDARHLDREPYGGRLVERARSQVVQAQR